MTTTADTAYANLAALFGAPATARPTWTAGRAPRMTHLGWMKTQGVEIGGTASNRWYARCTERSCRRWIGPFPNALEAKTEGLNHVHAHSRKG